MKKNFILVAILLAVGVVNASFFLSERENSAELRIDNLEMLAEGESFGALAFSKKDFFCEKREGGTIVEILTMHECSDVLGSGCKDEECPRGYSRQKEYKSSNR